ncbi:mco, partial [Symbiodinium necroappetens]
MLPVTNYRFRKSMGWEIKPALLYQAYVPTVVRDILYGWARGFVAVALSAVWKPQTFVQEAFVFAFVIWAACIISSPCNEWRGYTLQPKDKKLSFGEYFKPVNYARSTGIGATIMGISLFVGRLVTPFAETAFAYLKGHPVAGVAALAILVGGFKLISGGEEEEKTEEKATEAPERQGSMFITKSLTNSKVSFPKVWSETLTDCEKAGMWLATSAQQLRQQEELIESSTRCVARAYHVEDGPEAPARVAVSGRHSSGFAAALRAIRHEAIAAPVDSSVHGAEELTALFAEARIQLAVLADASASEASNVQEAARRLGASTVCANTLAVEGSSMPADAISEGLPKGSESSMLLFAHCSTLGSSAPRAAEVDGLALSARISRSTVAWEFCAEDTVLSLGLEAGSAAAVVDAMEAPLASGARVVCSAAESVWDLWSAIDEAKEASVAFVGSEWCWSLAKSYSSLAAPLRESLRSRFREKPFRHFVAAAPAGTVLSQDLAARWREIFNCPLTWHFSCAEVVAATWKPSTEVVQLQLPPQGAPLPEVPAFRSSDGVLNCTLRLRPARVVGPNISRGP